MQRPFFFVARLGDEKHYISLEHIAHVAIKAKDSALITVEGVANPIPLSGKALTALITLLDRCTESDGILESQDSTTTPATRKERILRKNVQDHSAKATKGTGDPRSSHPAIQAVKAALGRYPQKILYNKIIEAVGDEPDVDLMVECATVYASRGKFTGDLSVWLFDWYVGNHGIPTKHDSKQNNQSDDDGWTPTELTPEIIMASEGCSREEAEIILSRLVRNEPLVELPLGRAPRATTVPGDFQVTPQMRDWAKEHVPHIDLNSETDNFLDHHRAKGSAFKDWPAAWRTWMRNAVKFAGNSRQTQAEMNRGGGGLVL